LHLLAARLAGTHEASASSMPPSSWKVQEQLPNGVVLPQADAVPA